jgi:hypothetical protein
VRERERERKREKREERREKRERSESSAGGRIAALRLANTCIGPDGT